MIDRKRSRRWFWYLSLDGDIKVDFWIPAFCSLYLTHFSTCLRHKYCFCSKKKWYHVQIDYVYRIVCRKKFTWQAWPACLGKSCLQRWPLAGIWEHGFQQSPHHSLTGKSGSLCGNCLHKHCGLYWTPAFLPGVWNLSICEREGTYCQNPGLWVTNESPW